MDESGYDAVADLGELYDHVKIYVSREDVPFYVDVARESGGPVLEVGCGTGRVLLPVARAGVSIVGLDRSRAMLDRCIGKIAQEPAEVRERITVEAADMRSFELHREFPLVTAPFRGVQHLVQAEDQMAFLACARRHLLPKGLLVFDVFNPDPVRLANPASEESEDTPPTALPGNRSFRRTGRVTAIDRSAQVSSVELAYYLRDASGNEERRVHAFPMRYYFPEQIEQLLAGAGFSVQAMYGNFDRSPVAAASPEIIVVAEKSS